MSTRCPATKCSKHWQIGARTEMDRRLLFRRAETCSLRARSVAGHQSVAGKIPKRVDPATAPSIRQRTLAVMNIALGVLVLLSSFVAGTEPRDGSHVRTMDK